MSTLRITRDRRRTDFGSRSVRRELQGFAWFLLPRQPPRQEPSEYLGPLVR
jgi:hypothetical protein